MYQSNRLWSCNKRVTYSFPCRKMADLTLEDVLKEFPPGPLDFYRKQATFKWQDMRILVEGEDGLLLKVLFV